MKRAATPGWLLAAFIIGLASCCSAADTQKVVRTVETSKETLTIKNKLATAEGRVTDLISRLDSVSDDASRAKTEIHTTLMEVWKVVDLLGQDRCGDVVEKYRVAQKKAENKAKEQEEEIRDNLKSIENLKLRLAKDGDSVNALHTEIKAERSRRETLETEARDLRDKLHWASAVSNETEKYELVAERLQSLLIVVSERTDLLNRILTMVGDAHNGFSDWRKEIESLASVVRDAERDFAGGYQSAAVDGLRRHTVDLENRLKEALRGRESLADERTVLRRSLEALQKKISTSGIMGGASKSERERIVVQTGAGTSMLGVVTLCLISLCTGAVAVFLLSSQRSSSEPTRTPEKYGFTPTSGSRTSPGFPPSGPSPLQYANPGSASRTPGSRGSTPRRY